MTIPPLTDLQKGIGAILQPDSRHASAEKKNVLGTFSEQKNVALRELNDFQAEHSG